jgi:hypothetical protein
VPEAVVPRKRWKGVAALVVVVVGKPEGKRPLEGSRHLWERNVEMDHKKGAMAWARFICFGKEFGRRFFALTFLFHKKREIS